MMRCENLLVAVHQGPWLGTLRIAVRWGSLSRERGCRRVRRQCLALGLRVRWAWNARAPSPNDKSAQAGARQQTLLASQPPVKSLHCPLLRSSSPAAPPPPSIGDGLVHCNQGMSC